MTSTKGPCWRAEIMRIRHELCDLDTNPTCAVTAMSSELPRHLRT